MFLLSMMLHTRSKARMLLVGIVSTDITNSALRWVKILSPPSPLGDNEPLQTFYDNN